MEQISLLNAWTWNWKLDLKFSRIQVTGRLGRRSKQLLDEPKEISGFWKLKEEALDCSLWRTGLVWTYGPVLMQTAWSRMSVIPVSSVPLMLILPSSGVYSANSNSSVALVDIHTYSGIENACPFDSVSSYVWNASVTLRLSLPSHATRNVSATFLSIKYISFFSRSVMIQVFLRFVRLTTNLRTLKADSHIACSAHAVLRPYHASIVPCPSWKSAW